jgi:hypothetical protein
MRRVDLRTRKRDGVLRRREKLNAKHEMSGDTWIGESRKSLWIRWRMKRRGERGDLNGRQWRCWNREGGGECGGGHRRRRNSRWRPWGVAGGSVRGEGWRERGRWEEGEQEVVVELTWFGLRDIETDWEDWYLKRMVSRSLVCTAPDLAVGPYLSLLPRTLLIRSRHPLPLKFE